jgi:hypothetical protein
MLPRLNGSFDRAALGIVASRYTTPEWVALGIEFRGACPLENSNGQAADGHSQVANAEAV